MKIIIALDDTDNYTSIGTGELLEEMVAELADKGWFTSEGVTRHQLPIMENIRYTSHNSSMAVCGLSDFSVLREMTDFCENYVRNYAAQGSDPGLCIVVPELLDDKDRLLTYGMRALNQYIEKNEAYGLAERLNGVHLSEHGGEGIGVIGALAGASLRLGGNNGRFKGYFTLGECTETTVQELLAHPKIEEVRHVSGEAITLTDAVKLGERLKTAYLNSKSVLMITGDRSGGYRTLNRQEMKVY